MTKDRTSFGSNENRETKPFTPLVNKPKRITSPTANSFGNDAFDSMNGNLPQKSNSANNETNIELSISNSIDIASPTTSSDSNSKDISKQESTRRRGRPIIVTDSRYKVDRPKMISKALDSKLSTLKDYVEEFQQETGRITFEKYIDTLVEAYIERKLSYSKQDRVRQEIKESFERLNKE